MFHTFQPVNDRHKPIDGELIVVNLDQVRSFKVVRLDPTDQGAEGGCTALQLTYQDGKHETVYIGPFDLDYKKVESRVEQFLTGPGIPFSKPWTEAYDGLVGTD